MLDRKLWHADLTNDAIIDAVARRMTTLDNPGFCLICGCYHEGIDPDAENYPCEACGAEQVFGADTMLLVLD